MIVYPDTKVFIACPGNHHTGDVELLHQLCAQIIALGVDACMVYYPATTKFNREDPVDDFYKKYHLPYTVWKKSGQYLKITLESMVNRQIIGKVYIEKGRGLPAR